MPLCCSVLGLNRHSKEKERENQREEKRGKIRERKRERERGKEGRREGREGGRTGRKIVVAEAASRLPDFSSSTLSLFLSLEEDRAPEALANFLSLSLSFPPSPLALFLFTPPSPHRCFVSNTGTILVSCRYGSICPNPSSLGQFGKS